MKITTNNNAKKQSKSKYKITLTLDYTSYNYIKNLLNKYGNSKLAIKHMIQTNIEKNSEIARLNAKIKKLKNKIIQLEIEIKKDKDKLWEAHIASVSNKQASYIQYQPPPQLNQQINNVLQQPPPPPRLAIAGASNSIPKLHKWQEKTIDTIYDETKEQNYAEPTCKKPVNAVIDKDEVKNEGILAKALGVKTEVIENFKNGNTTPSKILANTLQQMNVKKD